MSKLKEDLRDINDTIDVMEKQIEKMQEMMNQIISSSKNLNKNTIIKSNKPYWIDRISSVKQFK